MENTEIFIITNGRSTCKYCIQSILDQKVPITFTVIQSKKWKHALHDIMERCQSPYFLRVDDDFILHKQSLKYILESLKLYKTENVAQYSYLLWETWTRKGISGVKLYNTAAMRAIGGHQFDKFGKTDRKTNQALRKAGYVLIRDRSIIGLHACGTWKEQSRYEILWQKASATEYKKSTNLEMKKYCETHDIPAQVKLNGSFLRSKNKFSAKKKNTNFYYFLTNGSLSQDLEFNGVKIR